MLWWRVMLILSSLIGDLADLTRPLTFAYAGSQRGLDTSTIPNNPKNSTNSPKHVDHHVAEARGSTRDESLVQFVAKGIKENEDQGINGVAQLPRFTGFIAQRPQHQNCQDEIFGPMPKFAHNPMNRRDIFGWNLRKQPGRKKSKELRRMGRGKMVRGKEKYQACPRADRQPIFDPRFPVMPLRDSHCSWWLQRVGSNAMACVGGRSISG